IVLLRMRASRFPRIDPDEVERTSIASPREPFSVLLRISTVWVPTEVVTNRLPPAAAPGIAFAPRLSKLLPSATSGPPTTASIVEPELATALNQSARAPLISDDFNVKFKVVPALLDEMRMLLLPLVALLRPNVLPLTVSRFSVPDVLTTERLSSKPPSIRQDVIAAVPVRLLKPTLPSSSAALLPLVPVTVENSSVKLLELTPRIPKFWFVPLTVTRRKVTFPAFSRYTPLPAVAAFAPVALAIVPPVALPPRVVLAPSPTTVKLPDVFFNMMPLGAPLLETLVSDTANGVVPEARVISTAVPVVVLIVPLVVVIVLVLSVASNPR